MNHYPLWKYLLILLVVLGAALYALPNLYPNVPAVQISHESGELSDTTLNVVKDADLILHIIDITNPYFEDHIKIVEDTLESLGCRNTHQVKIFNKIDALALKIHPVLGQPLVVNGDRQQTGLGGAGQEHGRLHFGRGKWGS